MNLFVAVATMIILIFVVKINRLKNSLSIDIEKYKVKEIIHRKIYDTETATLVFEEKYPKPNPIKLLSVVYLDNHLSKRQLYKTKNNNYFLLYVYLFNNNVEIFPLGVDDAKDFLLKRDNEAYIKEFGEIEEA